ncbi:MAG: peptidoglycan-binding protein [Sulfurovum sp.]|nr:peptidoglycan-binding protein [Sulfurovum sp.]
MKKTLLKSIVISTLMSSPLLYADFSDGLVGGLVGGAVGSVITNEIYNSNKASEPTYRPVRHRSAKKHSKKRRLSAPRITDKMKIQKALAGMGFYHGKIDGEVNSFETRTAIKELNKAYGIGNTAALKPEEKDTLIYLGTLFMFDRNLIARGDNKRTRGKRIQTALKILGFYHGKIDGAVGRGTRSAIAEYKIANGLGASPSLDFESEYRLVSSAREMNDKNINDSIESLKKMGKQAVQAPQPTQVQQAPKPVSDNEPAAPHIIKLQTSQTQEKQSGTAH